jgi:hypothetical protein
MGMNVRKPANKSKVEIITRLVLRITQTNFSPLPLTADYWPEPQNLQNCEFVGICFPHCGQNGNPDCAAELACADDETWPG